MTEVSDGHAARPRVRWYAAGVPEEVHVPEDVLAEHPAVLEGARGRCLERLPG